MGGGEKEGSFEGGGGGGFGWGSGRSMDHCLQRDNLAKRKFPIGLPPPPMMVALRRKEECFDVGPKLFQQLLQQSWRGFSGEPGLFSEDPLRNGRIVNLAAPLQDKVEAMNGRAPR